MTNDGNAILREITVQHPAAKHMIEIARTQDEEVGVFTALFSYYSLHVWVCQTDISLIFHVAGEILLYFCKCLLKQIYGGEQQEVEESVAFKRIIPNCS